MIKKNLSNKGYAIFDYDNSSEDSNFNEIYDAFFDKNLNKKIFTLITLKREWLPHCQIKNINEKVFCFDENESVVVEKDRYGNNGLLANDLILSNEIKNVLKIFKIKQTKLSEIFIEIKKNQDLKDFLDLRYLY